MPSKPAQRPSMQSMVRSSRVMPRVGAAARIAHFGGSFEPAVVLSVLEDGRRLEVRGESGELFEFVLSPATARFVSAERAHGPRLELLTPDA
jgi:hypothetical protein